MIRHILKDGTEVKDISEKVVPRTHRAYQILERTVYGNNSIKEQDRTDRRKVLL